MGSGGSGGRSGSGSRGSGGGGGGRAAAAAAAAVAEVAILSSHLDRNDEVLCSRYAVRRLKFTASRPSAVVAAPLNSAVSERSACTRGRCLMSMWWISWWISWSVIKCHQGHMGKSSIPEGVCSRRGARPGEEESGS